MKHKNIRRRVEVAIVGSGITGLSCARALRRHGVKDIAILTGDHPGASIHCAGMLAGGMADNFTRLTHTFGTPTAEAVWRYGNQACEALTTYALDQGLNLLRGRRLRLATSKHEHDEVMIAIQELQSSGLPAQLFDSDGHPAILSIQEDDAPAGWIDPSSVIKCLKEEQSPVLIGASLTTLDTGQDRLSLELSDGSRVDAELAVLACHTSVARFVPGLTEALVTYADQWQSVTISSLPSWLAPGTVFSAHHGYMWGAVTSPKTLVVGGGRQLRKLAGIGATRGDIDPRVSAYLLAQLTQVFDLLAPPVLMGDPVAGLEIRPCDELPVIGPMFGDGRILIAAGYMGQGLPLGFYAGICLAELIATGSCTSLPRQLWPERFRSLSS